LNLEAIKHIKTKWKHQPSNQHILPDLSKLIILSLKMIKNTKFGSWVVNQQIFWINGQMLKLQVSNYFNKKPKRKIQKRIIKKIKKSQKMMQM